MQLILLLSLLGLGDEVKAALPPVEGLEDVFSDEWTLWYDESVIPRAMQFGPNSDDAHVHDGYHFFNSDGASTNPNLEFPWRVGGGMDRSDVVVAKFYWHPQHKPVVYFPTVRSSVYHRQKAWDWLFPVDAVVGEVVALKRLGRTYPFEIRVLRREEDAWSPEVYRQYNNTQDVADASWRLGFKDEAHQVGNLPIQQGVFVDQGHPRPAVTLPFRQAELPVLPEALVERLLRSPIKQVFEPLELTARQTQILPKNYGGSHVGMDRDDCMKCHVHVAKHANEFDRPGRDWYGYVRGSDRIFSFHPFSNSSIATNGMDRPVRFSDKLRRSGHIKQYANEPGYRRLP